MKAARIGTLLMMLSMILVPPIATLVPASSSGRQPLHGSEKAAVISSTDGFVSENDPPLFPALEESSIISLSLTTPERSFEFQCDPQAHRVSVNGHLADEEIFCTLVSQIQKLPIDAMPSFAPEHSPILTLVIATADGAKHTARFYPDGGPGTQTHIASGSANAPIYHRTDAWRIGTLMMTCEGTRIQDESGNEIPVITLPGGSAAR